MPSFDFNTAGLREIIDNLQENYYAPIGSLFVLLGDAESSSRTLALLSEFLNLRQERLVPYLNELSLKANDKHDCATCTGKCHLEHSTYILQLVNSHNTVREAILGGEYPGEHFDLKNLVAATILIESTYLLPAITQAQKTINVSG